MKNFMETKIELPAGGILFLEPDKIYKIEKGRFLLKERLANGKCISHDHPVGAGEIIGVPDLFLESQRGDEILIENLEYEMEAIEAADIRAMDAEDFLTMHFPDENSRKIFMGVANHLQKRRVSHSAFYALDKKAYVLTILRRFSDRDGFISGEILNAEIFNMSKSHFYLIIAQLKEERYLEKRGKIYKLNSKKAMEYQIDTIEPTRF